MSQELKDAAAPSVSKSEEELIAEFEPEARYRSLTPLAGKVVLALCLILSLFHIYTAGFGVLQEYEHRSFHLAFVLCLIFLVYNVRKSEPARRASIIYSGIYALLGGGLAALMLGEVLALPGAAQIALGVVIAPCIFFFKERVWLPRTIVAPVDLVISVLGLIAIGALIGHTWPFLGKAWKDSGWPLMLWGALLFSGLIMVLGCQAAVALRGCLKGAAGYEIHPLKIPYFDVAFALIAFALSSYIIVDFDQFILRAGWPNQADYLLGVFAILLVLEGTRRSVGVPLAIISLVALIYCYVGPYLSEIPLLDFFAHRGYSLGRIIEHMYTGTEGIYGIPLGVCATFVFHFVLFGLFIAHTGLGQLFIDLAMAVAGGSPGGPAKVAVIASGFMGSISGSAIANTVTTGSFTIPLMKRVGYRPEFAGAVEASASAGGQIMPPIMGAAAFIMAEFLGIPYIKIAAAAILPAFFHFYAVGIMVHFEALKMGMIGLPREELPRLKDILRERGIMLLPLAVIVYLLLAGFTPFLAAFWAIIVACALGQIHARTMTLMVPVVLSLPSVCFTYVPFHGPQHLTLVWLAVLAAGLYWAWRRVPRRDWLIALAPVAVLTVLAAAGLRPFLAAFWTNLLVIFIGIFYKDSKMRLPQIIDALEKGTRNALAIGAAVASVGLIVGTTMLTGLGLKFGNLTVSMASATADFITSFDAWHLLTFDGVTLFFILVYTAFACFILGMGLPTTAQYIVAAIIAAPALMKFGIHPLLSHMFVFFYAILADVTPPVALAAYAAAGVSGGDPFKTGTIACSLSSAKYVVPFIFIYSPIVLWMPMLLDPTVSFNYFEFIGIFIAVFIGVTGMAAGWRGYFIDRSTRLEQIVCFVSALLFFVRGTPSALIGLTGLTIVGIVQWRRKRQRREAGLIPVAAQAQQG